MRVLVLFLLCWLPVMAAAQTDDRSYLTAFLEDNLSGAGRVVVVTGFEGALSSQATVAEITIADEAGIWLTLRGITLDWTRSALFSGRIEVNQLTADEILLDRLPAPQGPVAEAGEFALPELPVSVQIGALAANRIVLGAAVLGQPVEGRLDAALSLIGGEGQGRLTLIRTDDGPEGVIDLAASYANADKRLVLDLSAREDAGGLAVSLLGLPGAPQALLTIKGAGPLDDFAADVALDTDGVSRLAGQVTLKGQEAGATGFAADLSGDLAPLFLPDYAAFFGDAVGLVVDGSRAADGRLDLAEMSLTTRALRLQGQMVLAADGVPERFSLNGDLGLSGGEPVLLPLTTEIETRIGRADLAISYDATEGEGWSLLTHISGLDRSDFAAERLELAGSGRISRRGGVPVVGGTLRFDAGGLQPADPALAAALGDAVTGEALGFWRQGDGVLSLPRLKIAGVDYAVTAGGTVTGLGEALTVTGRIAAQMADLSRLSGLAGRDLGGAADIAAEGSGSPLTGAFDVVARAVGRDMAAGVAELDNLLRGEATIDLSARRDTGGTQLRSLGIRAASLSVQASGKIASEGSDLAGEVAFADLGALGVGYGGALQGKARLTGSLTEGRMTLEAVGNGLRIGQAQADRLLRGQSALSLVLALKDGAVQVETARLDNPQLKASATGVLQGDVQTLDLTARLQDLGLLLPEFPGALTVTGRAVQEVGGTTLDLRAKGPGQIDASVTGKVAAGFGAADLDIKGTGQAALVNAFIAPRAIAGGLRFDLRLNGPMQVSALSGRVALEGGRLSDPALGFALTGIAARAALAGARADVDVTADVSSGGSVAVRGTVGLAAPFAGVLAVDIARATLRDPDLYETTANGALTVQGPLAGGAMIAGRIALTETELRVPSTGFGRAGDLPGLRHVAEPADVRATRARAGLVDVAGAGGRGGAAFGLDVVLSAPNRVFVRGRGLDAELGGELRLGGTTAAVAPVGSFGLIRGRLEILGKRLDLTEAVLQMEGKLIPSLHIVAATVNDGITVAVGIDGPATDPVVSFTSTPDLPEEEVLAQLLFGQTLQGLSAFQALQLASAVATLAGKGGDGIVARARKGIGLDNLDVKTASDGSASVTAGKYLTKNIYSEFTVDQAGQSQINLNFDVSDQVRLRGRANSDGTAGLGIVVEKDY
jgi:translocation and assembly module TamB